MHHDEAPTLYYDGHCGLCSGLVQALLRLDDRAVLRFAPLQSAFAKTRLARHGLDPEALATVVLEAGGRAYVRSDAALRALALLGWPYRAAAALRVLPQGLRDGVYDWVARHRYRVFGQHATCWLPRAGWADRFVGGG